MGQSDSTPMDCQKEGFGCAHPKEPITVALHNMDWRNFFEFLNNTPAGGIAGMEDSLDSGFTECVQNTFRQLFNPIRNMSVREYAKANYLI